MGTLGLSALLLIPASLNMTNSRYHILGEVGQGQFGQVFCASDRTTGELVAMKKLDSLRFPTHQFLRELAVLVRLEHPNVVGLQGLEYSKTGRYLVIDYCQGGTLRSLMESKVDLSLAQKLQLVRDILLGLEHVHEHHIIHCDLKPDNILLNVIDQGWSAHIADFGIAHFLEPADGQNPSSGHTGSPAYMAPERFYGSYSPESDLYAVGVLLFEMVVGRRPFSGMPADILKAHLNQPLRIPQSIPSILKIILRKSLQKLPQNRYSSAASMRMMLETVIANLTYSGPLSDKGNPIPDWRTQALLDPELSLKEISEETPEEVPEEIPEEVSDLTPEPTPSVTDQGHPKAWLAQDQGLSPVRIIPLQCQHLQPIATLDGFVHGLWLRPQGCVVAALQGQQTQLSLLQNQPLPQSIQPIGQFQTDFGQSIEPSAPAPHRIDLDPKGQWLGLLQQQLPIPNAWESSSDAQANSVLSRSALPKSVLQVFNLSQAQPLCDRALYDHPLPSAAHQLWFTSSRHILVSFPTPEASPEISPEPSPEAFPQVHPEAPSGTTLQLWSRRGHQYWTYPLGADIHQAIQMSPDRLFALCAKPSLMGLWIDLYPLKIRQIPLKTQADWVGVTRWGFILASQAGELTYLNRRGRIMAEAQLPIPPETTLSAIATSPQSSLLWIATQGKQESHLFTLDLNLELPKVLLRL